MHIYQTYTYTCTYAYTSRNHFWFYTDKKNEIESILTYTHTYIPLLKRRHYLLGPNLMAYFQALCSC
jgi:hypothetical protein